MDYEKHINLLSDEDAGKLFKAIFQFLNGNGASELPPMANMAFSFITDQLQRDNEKWADIKEKRANAGRIGGKVAQQNKTNQANASCVKQNKTNQADTVDVTVNVTDICHKDIYPDMTPKNIKEKKRVYGEFKKVKLSDSEKDKLLAEYGESVFEACVKELDEYKEQTGKVYRNDNLAIRKWVVDAVKKKGGAISGTDNEKQSYEYAQVNF